MNSKHTRRYERVVDVSRLDIIDAAFHYASGDTSRDQYALFAFDVGAHEPPTMDEITDFVCARAQLIPELSQRIEEVPGNLDFPRWVRDDAPKASRVIQMTTARDVSDRTRTDETRTTRHREAKTWEDVHRAIEHLAERPVDATRAPWYVHVALDVTGVPHTDGVAVVVVFQVSHALVDGRGASRLARALFAPEPPAASPTPPTPARRSLAPTAAAALAALPFRIVTARIAAWRSRRDYARAHGSTPLQRDSPRPAIPGNADPTSARVVHVIDCAPGLFASSGVSVTTLGLTAVGVATERFLGGRAPETLNSLVPVAIPDDAPWSAVNRIVNGAVDLHVDIADIADRARAIRQSLSATRKAMLDPLLLRWIRAENRIPAPVFLAVRRRAARRTKPDHALPESVLTNVTAVSVDRGSSDLELCGARAVLAGGFPMLGPARSVTHGFYGLGDTVTVCVVACPDTFPDHERYAEILSQAVDEVAEATTPRARADT